MARSLRVIIGELERRRQDNLDRAEVLQDKGNRMAPLYYVGRAAGFGDAIEELRKELT